MRPRHTLVLILLAALPVGLAATFVSNGSLSTPSGASPVLPSNGHAPSVSLELLGGAARIPADRCGAVRHYRPFPAQGAIHFKGAVSRPGRWSVTVKLKACYAGIFEPAGDTHAHVHVDGRFVGSFPSPIQGYYFARAEVKRSGNDVARSAKVMFAIR